MKKHSHQEILYKLAQAAELARVGKSQVEVCQTLGVSVMTFHRWRKLMGAKAQEHSPAIVPELLAKSEPQNLAEMTRHLEELTIENRRLRKIVTDLLLEKTKLEEAAAAPLTTAAPTKTLVDGL